MKIAVYLRTFVWYILLACVVVLFFLPALITALLLPVHKRYTSKFLFFLLDCVYKATMHCLLVPITISGKEHIPQQASIFVANHESALDIPVLGSLMNRHPHIWFVLDRFARTPFLGSIIRRLFISVDQDCSMKSSRALIQGIRLVEHNKLHVLIFPEGGRYTDGKIHDFFQGFAILAKKTRQPVVPVMLSNLGKILPPGSFVAHYYPIKVVIGKPFIFEETETAEAFTQRVQQWFNEQIR